MGRYRSYEELRNHEPEGKAFRVECCPTASPIVVMAPHGGNIEPGTSQIARAVAGEEHSFYSFDGIKGVGCRDLHITSKCFDEPLGLELVARSETAVAIHGCRGEEGVVYIGGRNQRLRSLVEEALEREGFLVRVNPRYPGMSPTNICNRGRLGMGVQLEISLSLRQGMFRELSDNGGNGVTDLFHRFVHALKGALRTYAGRELDRDRAACALSSGLSRSADRQ